MKANRLTDLKAYAFHQQNSTCIKRTWLITEELRAFILQKIDSIGHLEVLLLLASDPQKFWTADTLSLELRTNVSMAQAQLTQLMDNGLLNQNAEGAYYFNPIQQKEADLTLQLSQIYRERRIMIINLIFSKPTERIRSLANAFKIRRGD